MQTVVHVFFCLSGFDHFLSLGSDLGPFGGPKRFRSDGSFGALFDLWPPRVPWVAQGEQKATKSDRK